MILDSLLVGVMLFSSFAIRTPNVQPNPDDYEVSIGLSHSNFYINRQWERELGSKYVDDLENEIQDLRNQRQLLKEEIFRLDNQSKPKPRKKRNYRPKNKKK